MSVIMEIGDADGSGQVIPRNPPGDLQYQIRGRFQLQPNQGIPELDYDPYRIYFDAGNVVDMTISFASPVSVDFVKPGGGKVIFDTLGSETRRFTAPESGYYSLLIRNNDGLGSYQITFDIGGSDYAVKSLGRDETGINLTYEVKGTAADAEATIGFFWSDKPNLEGRKESVLRGTPADGPYRTEKAPGEHRARVPRFNVSEPPGWASYLVAAIDYVEGDPDGVLPEASETNNTANFALATDLVFTQLDWDRVDGGVEITYQVLHGDAPAVTDIAFFWASGPSINSIISPALKTAVAIDPTRGSHPRDIRADQFLPPPPAAKWLVAALDYVGGKPNGIIEEEREDERSNVATASLDEILSAPNLQLQHNPSTVIGRGQDYTVSLNAINVMPIPMNFSFVIDWAEIYRDPPSLRPVDAAQAKRAANDVSVELQLGFRESKSYPLGDFAQTWDWIKPPKDDLSATIQKEFYDAEKLEGELFKKAIEGAIQTLDFKVAAVFYARLDNIKTVLDFVDALTKPTERATVGYHLEGRWERDGGIPLPALDYYVPLVVPGAKQDLYRAFLSNTVAAKASLGEAVALTIAGLVDPTRFSLLGSLGLVANASVAFAKATQFYRDAYDPPDPNYTVLAEARSPVIPSIESLPEGASKDLAKLSVELQAVLAAASLSRDRADGAAVAKDYGWQSRQLMAASQWMALASILESRIAVRLRELEPAINDAMLRSGPSVVEYVRSNGLPLSVRSMLSDLGWSIERLDELAGTLANADPASFFGPSLTTRLSAVSAVLSNQISADDLRSAVLAAARSGIQFRDLEGAERQGLDLLRANLEAGIQAGQDRSVLYASLEAYRGEIRRLALATGNMAAIEGDLGFVESTLLQLQAQTLALPGTPPVNPDTTVDFVGPIISNLSRFGVHRNPTRIVLTFNENLERQRAENLNNYILVAPGRDGRFGTRDDRVIPLRSATYNVSTNTVTLSPAQRRLYLFGRYRISVKSESSIGLTDLAGNQLDGDRDGSPGGDYHRIFGRKALAGQIVRMTRPAFPASGATPRGPRSSSVRPRSLLREARAVFAETTRITALSVQEFLDERGLGNRKQLRTFLMRRLGR